MRTIKTLLVQSHLNLEHFMSSTEIMTSIFQEALWLILKPNDCSLACLYMFDNMIQSAVKFFLNFMLCFQDMQSLYFLTEPGACTLCGHEPPSPDDLAG